MHDVTCRPRRSRAFAVSVIVGFAVVLVSAAVAGEPGGQGKRGAAGDVPQDAGQPTRSSGTAPKGRTASGNGPTTPILDSFTRPDEIPLAGNWAKTNPLDGWTLGLVSNAVVQTNNPPGEVFPRSYWAVGQSPADAEVWIKAESVYTWHTETRLYLRLQNVGSPSWSGYELIGPWLGTGDTFFLRRWNNGSVVTLGSTTAGVPDGLFGATEWIYFRVTGSLIEAFYSDDGVTWYPIISRTDTGPGAISGTGFIGIGIGGAAASPRIVAFGGSAPAGQGGQPGEQVRGTNCLSTKIALVSCAEQEDPVNTYTGSFSHAETDLSLPGIGVPLVVRRAYSSDAAAISGRFGPGWADSLGARLEFLSGGSVAFTSEVGQVVRFAPNGSGGFTPAPGVLARLSAIPNGYRVTAHDQGAYEFNSNGSLTSWRDPNGQGLTMSYDTGGRLATVTNSAGITATYGYAGAGSLVTSVTVPDGRSVGYAYTGGLLTSVTDVRGKVWRYDYDGSARLTKITDPLLDEDVIVAYGLDGRVTQQTDALGNTSSFSWNPTTRTSTTTAPGGGTWIDDYDDAGMLVSRRDPLGNITTFTRDANMNLTSVTDARGKTTTMTYDAVGNMLSRTGPAPQSYSESWTYTALNDVASHTDRRGNTTDFAYDARGNLVSVTGPDPGTGRPVTTYSRHATTGLVTAIREPNQQGQASPKDTVYAYDPIGTGNVVSVTSPEGNKRSYGYDQYGFTSSMVGPRGNVAGCACAAQYTWNYVNDKAGHRTQALSPDPDGAGPLPRLRTDYTYDELGRLASMTNPKGKTWSYTYNDANDRTRETAPNGSHMDWQYDARGNLTAEIDQLGNKTTYGYDDANRRTSMVEARGNAAGASQQAYTWSFEFDANGNLAGLRAPDPDGTGPLGRPFTEYRYDNYNRLESVIDPQGIRERLNAYDGNDNLVEERGADPDGPGPEGPSVTTYAYDALNRVVSQTDAEGTTQLFGRDKNGNETSQTTNPVGSRWTFGYDADNRVLRESDPRENAPGCNCPNRHTWTYGYDADGQIVSVSAPGAGGGAGTYTYDTLGQPVFRADANGNETAWRYDELGNLIETVAPGGALTRYTFDPNTNDMTARTDSLSRVTAFQYDLAHRMTRVTRASGTTIARVRTFAYDAAGRPTATVDAVANAANNPALGTTTTTYDPLGRVARVDYSDSTPDLQYTYSQDSDLVALIDGTGTQSFGRDDADRLSSLSAPAGNYVYRYNRRNQVTERTLPDGTSVSYGYDGSGRLAGVTTAGQTTAYAYDLASNLVTTTLPAANGHVETRTYNRAGRLIGVANRRGSTTLSHYNLDLDGVGNPTRISGSVTAQLHYDENDRVVEICYKTTFCNVSPTSSDPFVVYSYDAVGNRTGTRSTRKPTITFAYNALHELAQRSVSGGTTTQFSHNANGNLTVEGSRTFTWNTAGQLTGSSTGTSSIAYTYDGFGNRVTATSGAGAAGVVRSSWDVNNPLPLLAVERDGANALLRRYVDGLDTISMTTPAGVHYLHYDYLGSATGLTTAAGVSMRTAEFEPFGLVRSSSSQAGAPSLPLQYTGEYMDQATGLYNLRARHYDPSTARFSSLDPVQAPPTVPYTSEYAYVANRPTVWVDPSGESACDVRFIHTLCEEAVGVAEAATYTATSAVEGAVAAVSDWRGTAGALRQCMLGHVGPVPLAPVFSLQLCGAEMAKRIGLDIAAQAVECGRRYFDWSYDTRSVTRACIKVTLEIVTLGVASAKVASLAKLGNAAKAVGRLDPAEIRFSQDSISATFRNGRGSIDELAEGLRSGRIDPSDVPAVRLVKRDGQLFTLDNRRLEAFRRAGVGIPYRMATPEEIAAEAYKFTTRNGGTSIRVRGG